MSGGTRRGSGRKAIPIDLVELEKLCAMGCSDEEIAFFYGASVQTIVNRRKQPEFAAADRGGSCPAIRPWSRCRRRAVSSGCGGPGGRPWICRDETSSMRIVLPKHKSARDLGRAADKVTQAVARGEMTLTEGQQMMSILDTQSSICLKVDLVSRVEKIEENLARAPVSGPEITGLPDQAVAEVMPNPVDDVTARKSK